MLYPKFLGNNGKIGVCAPSDGKSDKLDLVRLDNAIKKLDKLGIGVIESSNVRCSSLGRSASGSERAKLLEELLLNNDVSVLISCSGGEFLVEVLSYLDFDVFLNSPKWFCGFSDNTGIGFVITTMLDIASIYSDNFGCFGMDNWHDSVSDFLEILRGNILVQNSFLKYQSSYLEYKIGVESYKLDSDVYWKNLIGGSSVNLEGRFIGGCLDVLLTLVGTKYDYVSQFIERYKDEGIVWFLESCELTSEGMIRGLWQLKEAGWFKYSKGFIFGRPVIRESLYDISYEESILEILGKFDIPIIVDADFGHTAPRMTLINGAYVKINSCDGKGLVEFNLK